LALTQCSDNVKGLAVHLLNRPAMGGVAAAAAIIAVSGGLSATATATANASADPTHGPAYVTVSAVLPAAAGPATGTYHSSRMSVEVVLAPRHQAQLTSALAAAYAHPKAGGHWLAKGQFAARYAPTAAARAAAATYLRARHLTVAPAASPFLLRAAGTSARVSAAFRTTLKTYNQSGKTYFANAAPAVLPAKLAPGVLGVVGLSNTVRLHSMSKRLTGPEKSAQASCQQPYPGRAALFNIVQNGLVPVRGYGGAPGCNGMTPAQQNSIYGAPSVGARGKGQGVTMGLFELGAYQRSDIQTYTSRFFGPTYNPPLTDVNVDGGPLHPVCPLGDTCPDAFNGYFNDIEVDADIETQLAIAPDVTHLLVYNAPNDFTGQTTLDEYARIASDNAAASVSSSYGVCENDTPVGFARAENLIFEQMALQGQSMFSSSGDTGAFDCLAADGTTLLNVDDPTAQPWVTSVGGTSLEQFNPRQNPHPAYPKGVETVWNPGNLCHASSDEGGLTGFDFCGALGAGGGGNSQYWGRPAYQHGPGVTSKDSTRGNGSTHCALAARGTLCREIPDISADADELTPYAEFCTGGLATPNSDCATFSGDQVPPGWFGIGGTSLSSPLWSAIIADRDSFLHRRSGNINPLVYQLYRTSPGKFFHDITGKGQSANNNGHFFTRPGYDLATGIGTPVMAALITGTR
jgi:subtilase family serine protease